MRKFLFSQKLAALGVAALGAIAATGIATAPAQAFTMTSVLEWDDGTSDFVEDATAVFNGGANTSNPNGPINLDTFDVTFSPFSLGETAAVFIADGDFAPHFPGLPDFFDIVPSDSAVGTFGLKLDGVYNTNPPATGIDIAAEFELQNTLTFTFDTDGIAGASADDVTATLAAGSLFLGELKDDDAVEFELELGEWEFTIPGMSATAFSSTFEFGQVAQSSGGGYQAEGIVGVPEPGTILGLLAVGGLGLGMKRKKLQ